MAMPTVVGVGTPAADVGPITPGLPAGIQANDILLLFVETANEEITVSGWELAPAAPAINATTGTRLSIFWKRASESESAPTTSDSGDHQIGQIMAVRGCYTGGNPFTLCRGGFSTSGSSKSTASTNTYVTDCLIIGAVSSPADGLTTPRYSAWTNASLTNIVERMDYFSDVGNGGGFGVATGERAATSYTQINTWTVTDGSTTTAGAVWIGGLLPNDVPLPFIRSIGSYAAGVGAVTPALAQNYAVPGDLIMVFCETNNQTITIGGYDEAPSSPVSNTGTLPTRLTVFYKRAGVAESNPTTSDSGDHQIAQTVCFGGVSTDANPFDTSASSAGGTGASVTAPGITTTAANTLVIAAIGSTRNSIANTQFSGWTNADLTDLNEFLDQTSTGGTGGGFGAAVGRKATPGTVTGTTATQAVAGEWTGWTAALKPISFLVTVEPGTLAIAGESGFLYVDKYFFADAASLSLTPATGSLIKNHPISVTPGELTLDSALFTILGPGVERSELRFLIDLIPNLSPGGGAIPTDAYQRLTQRMIVGPDATEVPIKSWTYSEDANSIGGSLNVELANVADRALFVEQPEITFEVGTWNGTAFEYTSLLSTGRLRNSNYVITGENGKPRDNFSIVAMTELEDKLSMAPPKNVIWWDPLAALAQVTQLPPAEDINGVVITGEAIAINGMTLHDILNRLFVTVLGFAGIETNIPNYPISQVRFEVGRPYATTIAGLIGMFEPVYTLLDTLRGTVISINDGTVAEISGIPLGRRVDISHSTFLGLSKDMTATPGEISGLVNVGAIEIKTTDNQGSGYGSYVFREEVSLSKVGNFGPEANEFIEKEMTERFTDFYHTEYGDRPYRSQLNEVRTRTYRNGYDLGNITEETLEKYSYQYSNLFYRYKSISALVPYFEKPVIGQQYAYTEEDPGPPPTSTDVYTPILGDWEYAGMQLQPVSIEEEDIERSAHPYNRGDVYISRRQIVYYGLCYIDPINQQLDEDYVRDAITVYRAGNVTGNMIPDWRKIKVVEELFYPNPDGSVRVRKTEHDLLSNQVQFDEFKEDDGQIGINASAGNQKKTLVYPDGETTLNGPVMTMNAGELPFDMAVALARRKLRLQKFAKEVFEFELIGLDPTLRQGTIVEVYGRDDEDFGAYVIESRTLSGGPDGYRMRIRARSAQERAR